MSKGMKRTLVLILSLFMVFTMMPVTAYADVDESVRAVSAIDYDGDEMKFVKEDLTSTFGMLSPAAGTEPLVKLSADGTKVHIAYTPSNLTIYAGFYIEADIKDSSTWVESKFIAAKEGGTYDFELDASYCGKAWPIAPVKKSDMTATTSAQYYLAIPAKDKLEQEGPEQGFKGVIRVFGQNRFETSRKVADELKEMLGIEKFDTVILAYGFDYPDALGGSYLSCMLDAPIILVDSSAALIKDAQDYIKANLKGGGKIYMLGGTKVVPEAAVEGLEGYETVRLGGENRFGTNIKILEEAAKFDEAPEEVLVCTAYGFADSLSAAATGKPILLVGNTLNDEQKDYLDGLEGEITFTAVGGDKVVTEDIMAEFTEYGTTDRVSGANRFATSIAVAEKYFENPKAGVLAYGITFPDGLCGGSLAHAIGAPLILTADSSKDAAVEYAGKAELTDGMILGGPTLISDDTARAIFHLAEDAEITIK